MDAQLLERLGLTPGEAAVYLALLKTGSSTVGPVVKESKIAYSNIYEVLDRLQAKGLASFILKAKTRYYQAVPPSRIADYLQKKEAEIKKEKETLAKLLPQLEALQALSQYQAEAEVFLGWEGVRSAYIKLIEGGDNDESIFFYIHDKDIDQKIDDFFYALDEEYVQRNMTLRGIAKYTYDSKHAETTPYITMRYVDFPVPNNLDICTNKIILVSWKVPLAVVITSKELADNFRDMFNDVWAQAKPKTAFKRNA